jgi:large subunit ribosomal protein L10e
MALRPGRTVREVERPWTRVSRRAPRESYVKGVPDSKIHMFEMGSKGDYDTTLNLVAKAPGQIRSNALEAARIVSAKFLELKLGNRFFYKFLLFPHHVLREKPIATGAGADRYSRGMKLGFGKPSGTAVQIKAGQTMVRLKINRNDLEIGKLSLKRAALKLSIPMRIKIEE